MIWFLFVISSEEDLQLVNELFAEYNKELLCVPPLLRNPLFQLKRLGVSLEVDDIPAILLYGKNLDDGRAVPLVRFSVSNLARTIDAFAAPIEYRGKYLVLRERSSNLLCAFAMYL